MKAIFFGTFLVLCSLSTSAYKLATDLPEIERDARALELYLQDKKDHEDHCPNVEWDQPTLSVYKETLVSHLPDGCIS